MEYLAITAVGLLLYACFLMMGWLMRPPGGDLFWWTGRETEKRAEEEQEIRKQIARDFIRASEQRINRKEQ